MSRTCCLPCPTLTTISFCAGSEVRAEMGKLKVRGQQEGPGPKCSRTTNGSQAPATSPCSTCSGPAEGRGRGRMFPPRPPVPSIAPTAQDQARQSFSHLTPSFHLPTARNFDLQKAEAMLRKVRPTPQEIWGGPSWGAMHASSPCSIPSSGVLEARWSLTTHLPSSTWSSGRPWTLTTSWTGSPQR